jgi:hypothetical protein
MIEVGNVRKYIKDRKLQPLPPYTVYIGRANPRYGLKKSPLANPFKITLVDYREAVIGKYRTLTRGWLRPGSAGYPVGYLQSAELSRLRSLHKEHGKLLLLCWCKPKACHGDVIKEVLEGEG